jgi:hypothetical protein
MNEAQVKCLLVLSVLAIIGFGPLSLTCLIGMYIVIGRPRWFYRLTRDLYLNASPKSEERVAVRSRPGSLALGVRLRTFMSLLILLILDIAPVPVTGAIAIYVVLTRPEWFRRLVLNIYRGIAP